MTLDLTKIVITAMVCVCVIESVALLLGHNGTVLATVVGAFCLIIGAIAVNIKEKSKT